jgi:hypothetical protein
VKVPGYGTLADVNARRLLARKLGAFLIETPCLFPNQNVCFPNEYIVACVVLDQYLTVLI